MAKLFIILGALLLIIGMIMYRFGNVFAWFGNLPGDIKVQKEHFSFFFPLTSMLLISLVLNILFRIYSKLSP